MNPRHRLIGALFAATAVLRFETVSRSKSSIVFPGIDRKQLDMPRDPERMTSRQRLILHDRIPKYSGRRFNLRFTE